MAYLERDGEPRSAGWRDLIMSLAVVSALAAGLLLSACGSNLPEMAQMIKEATLGRPASSDENLVNKGYREIEAGNYAYAEIYLDSALSINPSNPLALLNMAVVYEKTGRESEARALYSALIRRNPSDASGAVLTEENSGLSIAEAARENLAVLDRAVIARARATPTARSKPLSSRCGRTSNRIGVRAWMNGYPFSRISTPKVSSVKTNFWRASVARGRAAMVTRLLTSRKLAIA